MPRYRIVEDHGAFFLDLLGHQFRAQVRRWWGWKTIAGTMFREHAEEAIETHKRRHDRSRPRFTITDIP